MKQALGALVKELRHTTTLKGDILSALTPEMKMEYIKWYDEKVKRRHGGNWNTDFALLLKIINWEEMVGSDVFLEWLEDIE